ncbi:hypothetical protein KUTeg_022971 [Tegillarca granosa]|uniref:Uncharacterized protein n=1 Tax=Tegillarca granosa TaxID=220873 RepID=A0ABQ9E0A7_TEGGR|nr:hypothetical protein KUTeg_022971 [Tegillarca granosa]
MSLKVEMFLFKSLGNISLPLMKTKQILPEELLIHAPSEKEIVVAGGFDNEQEVRSSVPTRDLSELSASHEEADTRIILQAINAQTNSVVVSATDTDAIYFHFKRVHYQTCVWKQTVLLYPFFQIPVLWVGKETILE